MRLSEPAPAKLNLALHVRGKLADGRHAIETVFAFCVDGDRIEVEESDRLTLTVSGPFSGSVSSGDDNLVLRAAKELAEVSETKAGADLRLFKNLPVASGIGGGSADAAATLRLLTRLWKTDPSYAASIAPGLGSDVPACLLSLAARGEGAGDQLELLDLGLAGAPILLINPLISLPTSEVFAGWDGVDGGPLDGWREGRNDLEVSARALVPEIGGVLTWLGNQDGAGIVRMSGSGATCFGLFESEEARDEAAEACPSNWWHLVTVLR